MVPNNTHFEIRYLRKDGTAWMFAAQHGSLESAIRGLERVEKRHPARSLAIYRADTTYTPVPYDHLPG